MTYFVLAAVVAAFGFGFARRRKGRVEVAPGDPVSTLHLDMSKKQTKRTRAALDAATSTLR